MSLRVIVGIQIRQCKRTDANARNVVRWNSVKMLLLPVWQGMTPTSRNPKPTSLLGPYNFSIRVYHKT